MIPISGRERLNTDSSKFNWMVAVYNLTAAAVNPAAVSVRSTA
jgi:hypothetical protein